MDSDGVEGGLLHPATLAGFRGEHIREPCRKLIGIARGEEVSVLAILDEVRQRYGVGRDDR